MSSSAATETEQVEATAAIQLQQQPDSSSLDPSPVHELPPRPVPSSDPRLSIDQDRGPANSPPTDNNDEHDLFKLKPAEALQLLSASVELLVRITGDVPPTPPPKTPTDPQMSNMQVEKENIARSHSEKSLARLRAQALREEQEEKLRKQRHQQQEIQEKLQKQKHSQKSGSSSSIDGVRLKHNSLRHANPSSSAPNLHPPEPYIVVGADSQPLNLQHGAITRKFYSKNEPPISVNQYLLRLHQFCPMSTAVYLATSLYIHRLAVEERAIPVTRRNAHRLVLAGLRVAMKALEDLSYPHTKIAKVGGVSEVELARLEISFCFLAGFELVVGEEILKKHWQVLREGKVGRMVDGVEVPLLKLDKKRKTSREVHQLMQ
ncbi:cyclin domain-containing protein [Trichoderma breve]|uniref:Cyclin domain-containing protein n=1 Tax=Trichoderma breve TaxID=2034170 RepID=A0A9W9BDT8_9HYPO|nr:cyclin domain-containing protein [Trichoderma breve]KAJ4860627.1 cyclin domain-containing protein [Trichoderma breve]